MVGLVGITSAAAWFVGALDWPGMKRQIRERFPEVRQLEVEQLDAWLRDSGRPAPVLFDVRREEEFRVSHLTGARRLDPGANPPELPPDVDTTTPIVLYCSVGYRSSRMAQRLQDLGYSEVWNLEGSIFEWANAGHPVERDGEPVEEVHPYDAIWGGRFLDRHLWAFEPDG